MLQYWSQQLMLFFSLLHNSDITYWIKYFDKIKCYSDQPYLVFFSLKPEIHTYFFLALAGSFELHVFSFLLTPTTYNNFNDKEFVTHESSAHICAVDNSCCTIFSQSNEIVLHTASIYRHGLKYRQTSIYSQYSLYFEYFGIDSHAEK